MTVMHLLGGRVLGAELVRAAWVRDAAWLPTTPTTLRPSGPRAPPRSGLQKPTRTGSDLAIADAIVAELERRLVVDPNEIDVTVIDGRVTLDGTVPDWRTRNAVHEAARYTLGVVDVVDNLAISRW